MKNALILRKIALLVIAAAPLRYAVEWIVLAWEMNSFKIIGASYDTGHLEFNFDLLWLGVLILIIAEVFRIGTALQEEQALTV